MGGKKGSSLISKATGGLVGDNSVIAKIGNSASRTVSGGSYSFDGRGYTQGNTFGEGISGIVGADYVVNPYRDKKKRGEELADKAQGEASAAQAGLLRSAKDRQAQEAATAEASDTLARRLSAQKKRSRGTGRQSTIVTGSGGGEETLGTISTSGSLLGV